MYVCVCMCCVCVSLCVCLYVWGCVGGNELYGEKRTHKNIYLELLMLYINLFIYSFILFFFISANAFRLQILFNQKIILSLRFHFMT